MTRQRFHTQGEVALLFLTFCWPYLMTVQHACQIHIPLLCCQINIPLLGCPTYLLLSVSLLAYGLCKLLKCIDYGTCIGFSVSKNVFCVVLSSRSVASWLSYHENKPENMPRSVVYVAVFCLDLCHCQRVFYVSFQQLSLIISSTLCPALSKSPGRSSVPHSLVSHTLDIHLAQIFSTVLFQFRVCQHLH